MIRHMKFLIPIFILIAIAGSVLVSAQGELLVNPGLEEGSNGPYTTRRGGEFPIYLPNGWNYWLAPSTGEYLNRSERVTINPHPGPAPNPHQGSRAVNVDCGFVTCTVALFQQVAVQTNTPITASGWAQVKACNLPQNGTSCGSAVESGAQTRIGIDPNGGTDPNDTDIVWSSWAQPHDQWLQMSTSTTTTGTTATIFLYSTQGSPADLNRTYWDELTLSGAGGSGTPGATAVPPTPTPIPEVPFVSPQGARPDGSIVHVVGSGDTLDSIAFAYGITRTQLLEQNNLASSSVLRIGQEIVVSPPQVAQVPTPVSEVPAETIPEQPVEATEEIETFDARIILPTLIAPEGTSELENSLVTRRGITTEGQQTAFLGVTLVSETLADVLINDYNEQLAALGWSLVTGAAGENFAWSSWTFNDATTAKTWGGTLYLSASPIAQGQYNLLIHIEES